ncbi:uncharacterized protein LOC112900819 [Panicum hallii]|jgi:hypothetical protein|uniref:uncharacterized protein LOC112900819 n=1 Tax=Panicum hallii TaxID=206008 RepID=UPI000DF4D4BC|nr:uncharacterized protein LOC112900819 [Panicum hallii]
MAIDTPVNQSLRRTMAMPSGWADLPDDLLDIVAKRTPGIKDYVRLRAVCKSWRSFLLPKSTPPWVMLPYDPSSESCTRAFLDVSDGTVYELELPETRGKRCCGSSPGWLVLERWPDVWLLNLANASWRTLAFAPGAFTAVDVTYQEGAFRLVSHYGRVAAFDLVSTLREVPTRRDALHALAHTWDGQCLVQRGGGKLLMAAWSGGRRPRAGCLQAGL